MKLFSVIVVASAMFATSVAAFSVNPMATARVATRQSMFTGAGEGMPMEDNPDEMKKLEEAAKTLGMSVDEYKLGITARIRLTKSLDEARCLGGNKSKVAVERDGNNPPRFLEVTITDAGKALGKEALGTELVSALKSASDEGKKKRSEAQREMMTFISEEMKKMGAL